MKEASKKLAFYWCNVRKNIFFGEWLATFEKKFGLIITVISCVGSILIFSVCCILGYIELVKEKNLESRLCTNKRACFLMGALSVEANRMKMRMNFCAIRTFWQQALTLAELNVITIPAVFLPHLPSFWKEESIEYQKVDMPKSKLQAYVKT